MATRSKYVNQQIIDQFGLFEETKDLFCFLLAFNEKTIKFKLNWKLIIGQNFFTKKSLKNKNSKRVVTVV
jgi:hypothetical protein